MEPMDVETKLPFTTSIRLCVEAMQGLCRETSSNSSRFVPDLQTNQKIQSLILEFQLH